MPACVVRYHRGQCARGTASHGDSVSDSDSQADGFQELLGQEPRGCRDPGLHVYHLLRQDRYPHTEQDDSCAHVV